MRLQRKEIFGELGVLELNKGSHIFATQYTF